MKNLFKMLLVFTILLSFSQTVFAKDYAERIKEKRYRKALILGCDHIQVKSPATAAILGILPGGGSFYTGAMGLGIADFLLYPFSSIWDIPMAYSRAKKMNMDETIFACEVEGNKL